MGHVVGLDHSDACGEPGDNSVMKAVLRRSDPRFRLPGSDDVSGADFIYPPATATRTPTPTPGGEEPSATATAVTIGQAASSGGGCDLPAPAASRDARGAVAAGAALWGAARRRRTGHLARQKRRGRGHKSGPASAAERR